MAIKLKVGNRYRCRNGNEVVVSYKVPSFSPKYYTRDAFCLHCCKGYYRVDGTLHVGWEVPEEEIVEDLGVYTYYPRPKKTKEVTLNLTEEQFNNLKEQLNLEGEF